MIERHGLPWHVQRLGCRAEYWFCPPRATAPPRPPPSTRSSRGSCTCGASTGGAADAVPQHGAVQPAHTEADVDRHTEVFAAAVDALLA